jgi:hypothetical protein
VPTPLFHALLETGAKLTQAIRADGWVNTLTGIGGARDKARASKFAQEPSLTIHELDSLFNGDDLAHTIVTQLPTDAMREGFGVCRKSTRTKAEIEASRKDAERILKRFQELHVGDRATDARIWGRLFGGGALILGVEGSGLPDMPLVPENVTRVAFVDDADRGELHVASVYTTGERAGEPETYYYNPTPKHGGVSVQRVLLHESRVICFGVPGPRTAPSSITGAGITRCCSGATRFFGP